MTLYESPKSLKQKTGQLNWSEEKRASTIQRPTLYLTLLGNTGFLPLKTVFLRLSFASIGEAQNSGTEVLQ